MKRRREMAVVAAATWMSLGCTSLEPEHTVPAFSAGGGSGLEDESGDAPESDGGAAEGPLESGPLDAGDDGGATDGADDGVGVDGGPIDDDGGAQTTGPVADPPPFDPVYRVAARIHVGESNLTDTQLENIFAEINLIWRSQAAICFEFEVVTDDAPMTTGFDMWFKPDIGGQNGFRNSDHDMQVVDAPSLSSVANPAMIGAARTAAHTFGHGLTLEHDSVPDDSLMASGTFGWALPMYQVDAARASAMVKGLEDTTPTDCGAPVFAN